MKRRLQGTVWRLTAFMAVCGLGLFGLLAVFAELRFYDEQTYTAIFSDVSGLEPGNFVRIAGVEVGKVKGLSIPKGATVEVTFSTDPSVVLTEGSRAVIRYDNLVGGRYLAIEEGVGGLARLPGGATIPVEKTSPALDLDALIGGFRPLFAALDPEQVNALSNQLIQIFQGQGRTIESFLAHTAVLTATLADRDQLVSQVIGNLNTVLSSLGHHSDQLDNAVESLSVLVDGLTERKAEIANGLSYVDAAAATITDLLGQARPPLRKVVHEADRVGTLTSADHDYLDKLLAELPDKYRTLSRLGLYGDYFSFYLCDLVLKLNGKGGQPVYVKVAGQSSGRCAPK